MTSFLEGLKKDERGLTLIELLAVVVILAIVAAIAFVLIGNVIENSKEDAAVSDALQMISAAKLSEATGKSLENTSISLGDLQGAELIGEIFDPWTKGELPTTAGAVSKSGTVYSVTLNTDKCDLSATEAELIEDGRDNCQ